MKTFSDLTTIEKLEVMKEYAQGWHDTHPTDELSISEIYQAMIDKHQLWVKENFEIIQWSLCYSCGSDSDLFLVKCPDQDVTNMCRSCYNKIKTYDEYMDNQLNLTIDKELLHE